MAQLPFKTAQFKIDTFLEYETLEFGSAIQFSGNRFGLTFTFIGTEKKRSVLYPLLR